MQIRQDILARATLAAVLFYAPIAVAAMYKWVDESGKVHYGDKVPAQYASQLNKSGTVVRQAGPAVKDGKTEVAVAEDPAVARKREEQARQDRALLATYSSEQEIDAARERELKRVRDWAASIEPAAAKAKGDEKARYQAMLDQAKSESAAINAKFDGFKTRFVELKKAQEQKRS